MNKVNTFNTTCPKCLESVKITISEIRVRNNNDGSVEATADGSGYHWCECH